MPPVILDEFHGLGRVVDVPLGNGSIERIPLLLQYGALLVPIAPDDDGFRVGSCEYGSFVIGEKLPELLLRLKRNTLAPVKVAASAFRILVKADLAPFLGGEITIERIVFPEFPQRHLGAEPDDSVAAGAAMAPSTEIPRHSTGRLQLLRHHGCKRPSADRAADAAGCHPHEGNVWAQADQTHSVVTNSLDQGIAVEVTVARGIAHPVADLRDTRITGMFDMSHQLIGHVHVLLCQVVFMVVKRIHRPQRFAAVPIFGFGLLHIADNESAAAQRSRHRLNNRLYSVSESGGFGRNRSRGFRLLLYGQPFGDHPRGTVHVREDVEQVGRFFTELRQPVLDIGSTFLAGRRGEVQHRTAQGRRKFGDQLFADVVGISVASAKRTVQTLRMPSTVRDFIRNFG